MNKICRYLNDNIISSRSFELFYEFKIKSIPNRRLLNWNSLFNFKSPSSTENGSKDAPDTLNND